MRALLSVGLLLVLSAIGPLWIMLAGVPPEALDGAQGAGVFFLTVSFPLLGIAGLLLIPSSLALFARARRKAHGIHGPWILLWGAGLLYTALCLALLVIGIGAIRWT